MKNKQMTELVPFTLKYFQERINEIASSLRHRIGRAETEASDKLQEKSPTRTVAQVTEAIKAGTIILDTSGSTYWSLDDLIEHVDSEKVKANQKLETELKEKVTQQANTVIDLGILGTDIDLLTKINEFETWASTFEYKFD